MSIWILLPETTYYSAFKSNVLTLLTINFKNRKETVVDNGKMSRHVREPRIEANKISHSLVNNTNLFFPYGVIAFTTNRWTNRTNSLFPLITSLVKYVFDYYGAAQLCHDSIALGFWGVHSLSQQLILAWSLIVQFSHKLWSTLKLDLVVVDKILVEIDVIGEKVL